MHCYLVTGPGAKRYVATNADARAVLPEGLTPSRLYMSGSVRSWIHYI